LAKVAVFTCILPHTYTKLGSPIYCNYAPEVLDFWCISDHPHGIHPWNDFVVNPDPELTSRRDMQKYKMLSHKYLSEYDYVIWQDGSVRLKVDPLYLIELMLSSGTKIAFGTHPWRVCSYEEGRVCAGFKSNSAETIGAQLARYEGEGFPPDFGLAASTFFVRDNRDPETAKFFELWYEETMSGSHRNQVSFGYAWWKSGVDIQLWKLVWGKNEFWEWNNDR